MKPSFLEKQLRGCSKVIGSSSAELRTELLALLQLEKRETWSGFIDRALGLQAPHFSLRELAVKIRSHASARKASASEYPRRSAASAFASHMRQS